MTDEVYFTLMVEALPNDPDLTYEDLRIVHGECGGGRIAVLPKGGKWHFDCRRCETGVAVQFSKDGTAAVMRTAIDGKKRKIDHYKRHVVAVRAEQGLAFGRTGDLFAIADQPE